HWMRIYEVRPDMVGRYCRVAMGWLVWGCLLGIVPSARAQGVDFAASSDTNPVTLSAQIISGSGNQPARLEVKAVMSGGYYIYSITQPPGGPIASKITVPGSDQYRLLGDFQPS